MESSGAKDLRRMQGLAQRLIVAHRDAWYLSAFSEIAYDRIRWT